MNVHGMADGMAAATAPAGVASTSAALDARPMERCERNVMQLTSAAFAEGGPMEKHVLAQGQLMGTYKRK
jgi:phosphatidylethanolamine-binding protein (PEBP) family uncharacterized protein